MNIRKIIREEVDDFDWASDIEEVYIYKLAEEHFKPLVVHTIPSHGIKVKRMSEEWEGRRVPTALIEIVFEWIKEEEFKNKLYELVESFREHYSDKYPLRVAERSNRMKYSNYTEGSWMYNFYRRFGFITIEVLDPSVELDSGGNPIS